MQFLSSSTVFHINNRVGLGKAHNFGGKHDLFSSKAKTGNAVTYIQAYYISYVWKHFRFEVVNSETGAKTTEKVCTTCRHCQVHR